MTTKEFNNLKWGQLIYHNKFKRIFLCLGWKKGKIEGRKTLRARPSFISPEVVYFTSDSARYLKITHL
jgi:hypothetical protein